MQLILQMRSGKSCSWYGHEQLTWGRKGVEDDTWLATAALPQAAILQTPCCGKNAHIAFQHFAGAPALRGCLRCQAERLLERDIHAPPRGPSPLRGLTTSLQHMRGAALLDGTLCKSCQKCMHVIRQAQFRRLHARRSRTIVMPVAAWTSTRVPGCTYVASCRHAIAVRNTVGAAAASVSARPGGHGQTMRASTCTVAPRLPVAWPYTQSPTLAASPLVAVRELVLQQHNCCATGRADEQQ